MSARLFINYRREDTAPYAGRLYDRLSTHFGEDHVFIDIDQIEPGEDFVEAINRKVGSCDIAIVAIGPHWLSATDESGQRRLDDPEDFVRAEIVAALERKILVIPVLVGGARMPRRQDLPEPLAPLSRRNAIELSETRFHADVNRLIEAIEKSVSAAKKNAELSAAPVIPMAEPASVEPREPESEARERTADDAERVAEEKRQAAAQFAEQKLTDEKKAAEAEAERLVGESQKREDAAARAVAEKGQTISRTPRRVSWPLVVSLLTLVIAATAWFILEHRGNEPEASSPTIAPTSTPLEQPTLTPTPVEQPVTTPTVAASVATQTPVPPVTQPKEEQSNESQFSGGYDPAIAVIDMNRVFKEYTKTKEAEKKINDAKDAAKKDYDGRADAYKKALDEINRLNKQLEAPTLSATVKTQKAKERDQKIANIKNMEREINEFRQTREKQLQEQAVRMRDGIVKEITDKLGSLAGNVENLIFDTSGISTNGVPFVMYSPNVSNISSPVVSALNLQSSSNGSELAASHDLRFATIDMNRAFKEYNKTKNAEVKINDAKDAAKKEYNDRADVYKKALDEINRLNKQLEDPTLSAGIKTQKAKERDDKIAKIKDMEREINDFRQAREKQLQEQALRMREGIVKEITDVVLNEARSNSIDVVLDLSGVSNSGVTLVLYRENRVSDFTDQVVAKLNDAAPGTNVLASVKSSRQLRFGAIDMNRVFKELPETKKSEAKINDAKEAAKKDYDDRSDAYKKALDEINRLNKQLEDPTLSTDTRTQKAKERDEKIAKVKDMEREINSFREKREQDLKTEAVNMRDRIVATIESAAKTCAERGRFDLVFDSSGVTLNGVPALIRTHDLPDLSDAVIKECGGH